MTVEVIWPRCFIFTEFEASTGLMDCAWRPEVQWPLLIHCSLQTQCLNHCGSGVWEPQDLKVTHEQETGFHTI